MPHIDHFRARRRVLAALGAIAGAGLAGCSNSTYELVKATYESGHPAHRGGDGYPMSAEQIAQLPYATLGVRVHGGAAGVMVLAKYQGDDLVWASVDHVVFTTRGGRLVQTAGMPRDLAGTQSLSGDPLLAPPRPWPEGDIEVRRLIDLRDPVLFSVPVNSKLHAVGTEDIRILDNTRHTVHVREEVNVPQWRWTTHNDYWIGIDDGRVWRSDTRYCPEVPAIRLELLKPAR